eukprot:RCo055230
MVYHSALNEHPADVACGCSILPLRTRARGPAPLIRDNRADILDEVLLYFKPNVLYRTFEVKGPADRVLIYMTFYSLYCLKKIGKQSREDASRMVSALASQSFPAPGERGFHLPQFFAASSGASETELWRTYFRQLREELGLRLVELIYKDSEEGGAPSKFWTMFARRRFLGLSPDM